MQAINWPKDWAKLLMNTVLVASDCLPRGGKVSVETGEAAAPSFRVRAAGTIARITAEAERALAGESTATLDGRSIQPYLTHQLGKSLNARLTVAPGEGEVVIAAG